MPFLSACKQNFEPYNFFVENDPNVVFAPGNLIYMQNKCKIYKSNAVKKLLMNMQVYYT